MNNWLKTYTAWITKSFTGCPTCSRPSFTRCRATAPRWPPSHPMSSTTSWNSSSEKRTSLGLHRSSQRPHWTKVTHWESSSETEASSARNQTSTPISNRTLLTSCGTSNKSQRASWASRITGVRNSIERRCKFTKTLSLSPAWVKAATQYLMITSHQSPMSLSLPRLIVARWITYCCTRWSPNTALQLTTMNWSR